MTKRLYIILISALMCCQGALAQEGGEMIRGKVLSETGEEVIGAQILEIDATVRVLTNTVTDINGEFSMKVKNTRNKLRVSYIGYRQQEVVIGTKRDFRIVLEESNVLKEVVVTSQKTVSAGGLAIPEREVTFASQKINVTTVFLGQQVASIDDALQGHIAGLDIVGSGNVGTSTQMRLRGISTLSSNAAPLVVINGIQRPDISTADFDFAGATEQQFSDLLMINPEDIEEILVLKDAGATARYGSRGASGVLEITTKRGKRGATRINYSYKFLGAQQPQGLKMLNGDDYTMLMKQARFNRSQNPNEADIKEFAYDPTWSEYRHYNNNTDWRKEVTQYGLTHDHNLTIFGGGERAKFRISAGYMNKAGSIIGQEWNRFTSRMILDYDISERIKVSTEMAFTYSDNDQNYEGLLGIAYKKMPNMSVHYKDENGRDLPTYYTMLPSSSLYNNSEQGKMRNPVAVGRLATNNSKAYDVVPTMRLSYDLIERKKDKELRYEGYITFNMNNSKNYKFLPKELSPLGWNNENINKLGNNDGESFSIQSENKLVFGSMLGADHRLSGFVNFHTQTGSSNSQRMTAHGFPSQDISVPYVPAYIENVGSDIGQWRSLDANILLHYAFRSKYMLSASMRYEGSTKFGKAKKWGSFPGVSLRWNVSDESFMKFSKDWLTLWGIRGSWGQNGHQPGREYMHFSVYRPWNSYLGLSSIVPDNIRLSNLKWEVQTEYNLGTDLDLWEGKISLQANFYHRRTDDMLFPNAPLPGSTGFDNLLYRNIGSMRNIGWDLNIHFNRFIKFGNFSVDGYFNTANQVNAMIYLDPEILEGYNKDFEYTNRMAPYLQHLEPGHAYGSIYGFRYKGVYQYSIDHPVVVEAGYDPAKSGTSPVARDANGNVILDSKGKPLPIYYCYGPKGINYEFTGGDAIYEDINHDGQIDEDDIVYLGNSNPKLNGGFGLIFRWKSLSCNAYFVFRYGQKIINQTRRDAESMLNDNNQSIATNWRWRREGDQTVIPRALRDYGWNSLPSDRYMEDGSFLRFKTLTVNYAVPPAWLNKYYIKTMTLSLSFNNILCLTKYQGVDPEIPNNLNGQTMDNSITPRSKDITLGLAIGL